MVPAHGILTLSELTLLKYDHGGLKNNLFNSELINTKINGVIYIVSLIPP